MPVSLLYVNWEVTIYYAKSMNNLPWLVIGPEVKIVSATRAYLSYWATTDYQTNGLMVVEIKSFVSKSMV